MAVDLTAEFEAPETVAEAPSVDLMAEFDAPDRQEQHAVINESAELARKWKTAGPMDRLGMLLTGLGDRIGPASKETLAKSWEDVNRPMISAPMAPENVPDVPVGNSPVRLPVLAGAYNGVIPVINSLTSPLNVGTLGLFGGLSKVAQGYGPAADAAKHGLTLIKAAFAAEMAKGAGESAGQASVSLTNPDATAQEKVTDVVGALTSSALAVLAGKSATVLEPGAVPRGAVNRTAVSEALAKQEGVRMAEIVEKAAPEVVPASPEVVADAPEPVNIGDRSDRPTGAAEEAIVAEQRRLIDEHLAEQAKVAGQPDLAKEFIAPEESTPDAVRITEELARPEIAKDLEAPQSRTAVMNAVVDAERVKRGLEPAMEVEARSDPASWAEATRRIDENPSASAMLVDELKNEPRAINDVETALIRHQQIELQTRFDKVADEMVKAADAGDMARVAELTPERDRLSNDLLDVYEAGKLAGTETARGLRARRVMQNEDFSLARMVTTRRAANDGRPLTPEQMTEVEGLHKKITETQKAFDDYVAKVEAAQKAERGTRSIRKVVVTYIGERATEARARIKARQAEGRAQSGLDPADLADHAIVGADYLARGVDQFATWSESMVKEFGDRVKPHLQAIYDKAKAEVADASDARALAARKKALETRIKELTEKVETGDTSAEPARAARPSVKEIETLEQQRDTLSAELTRMRETEAKVKELTEAVAEKERKIAAGDLSPKGQPVSRPSVAALEKLKQERDALNRDLADARKEARKPTDAEVEAKKLEAMNERIAEKKAALKSGDLTPERKAVNRPMSPELEKAKQELEALNKEIAEARPEPEPVIGGEELTPEQRSLKSFKTRTTNRITDLERRVEESDFSRRQRIEFAKDPEANALQAKLDAAKEEYAAALEKDRYENLSNLQKAKEQGIGFYDMARTLMTTGEFSFILRQGKMAALSHPIMTARTLKTAAKAFIANPEAAHAINLEVLNHPDYPAAKAAKLHLLEKGQSLNKQEEILMAAQLAEKLPVAGKLVRAFNQSAEAYLNKLRFDLWRSMRDVGGLTAKEDAQLAKFVNESTGRGSLGPLEAAAVPLGRAMFSPRFFASRLQTLVGHSMWGGTPRTRKIIAKEYAKALVGLAAYYGAWELRNQFVDDKDKAKIGTDPRSSDFGKIVLRDTRLDPLAGLAQMVVFGARTATGEKVDTKGKMTPLRGKGVPYGGDKWSDVATNFARSKLHPVPGAIVNLFDGTDLGGNEVTLLNQTANLSAPLTYMDIYEALEEQDLPEGVALGLLATLGEGLQTYGKKKSKAAPIKESPAPASAK